MKEELYYTVHDLMGLYNVSINTAQRIMREIKAYSDTLKVRGRVARSDFVAWERQKLDEGKRENTMLKNALVDITARLMDVLGNEDLENLMQEKGLKVVRPWEIIRSE